jgi:hypothetical protein
MQTRFLAFAFALSLFPVVNAQFTEPKFGKIDMADLAMTKYDKDTTAGALILFDNGNSQIILGSNRKFQYEFDRHLLIKVFRNSAFDVAERKIRLYENSDGREELKNLNAVTYNLADGKIVKTKLDNKKIYKTDDGKYMIVNFAFPEVKEGSVIELSYSIVSDFLYNFRGWNFQYNYPARWSQYTYEIPEYFVYSELSKGYLNFEVQKKENTIMNFSVVSSERVGNMVNEHTSTTTDIIQVDAVKKVLATKDVPAFILEPYIDCEDNYIQSIEFELSNINIPGSAPRNFAETWESVNKLMVEDKDFGVLLENNKFVTDTISAICKDKLTDLDKANAIYDYVRKNIRWNGNYRIWATHGLKKPFEERVANSCEMNLLLTLMLRTVQLTSNPVLFSTRDNGIALSHSPSVTNFNSVLSTVVINGKVVLLDATQKFCPFGVLPANDINGKGRVIDKYSGDWVDLITENKYDEHKNYVLKITPDGNMTGSISGKYNGYAGIDFRKNLDTEKTNDDYIKHLQENTQGFIVNKFDITDISDINKPVSSVMEVDITDNMQVVGDKILFNPLLFERTEKNRFTLEDRMYPVNFNYPVSEQYDFEYTLPAGYVLESMPESFNLSLPDNSISISYSLKNKGDKIEVRYVRNIDRMIFLPTEYKRLKGLYDQMIKKHSEEIILKKST